MRFSVSLPWRNSPRSAQAARCGHSAARRQRGGRMGAGEGGGYHAVGHHPAARSSSSVPVSQQQASSARRQRGGRMGVAERVVHRVSDYNPATCQAPHGASTEGGWVRLSVSVLCSYGTPPAQAARSAHSAARRQRGGWAPAERVGAVAMASRPLKQRVFEQRRTAPARWEDGRG